MSFSNLRDLPVPFSVAACIAALILPTLSNAQAMERSQDGVVLHSSSGTLHVAVCSERVIHVVASATDEFPNLSCLS